MMKTAEEFTGWKLERDSLNWLGAAMSETIFQAFLRTAFVQEAARSKNALFSDLEDEEALVKRPSEETNNVTEPRNPRTAINV